MGQYESYQSFTMPGLYRVVNGIGAPAAGWRGCCRAAAELLWGCRLAAGLPGITASVCKYDLATADC